MRTLVILLLILSRFVGDKYTFARSSKYYILIRARYQVDDYWEGWELDAIGKPTIQTFYYIPVSVS